MNKDTINRTIAEAVGWKDFYQLPENDALFGEMSGRWTGTQPDGKSEPVPDYTDCLNAMHSAEMTLKGWGVPFGPEDEARRYFDELIHVCIREHPMTFTAVATAPQRAEAFLQFKGLWTPTGEENE